MIRNQKILTSVFFANEIQQNKNSINENNTNINNENNTNIVYNKKNLIKIAGCLGMYSHPLIINNECYKYNFKNLCTFIDNCQENIKKNRDMNNELFQKCVQYVFDFYKKLSPDENNLNLEKSLLKKKLKEVYKKYNKNIESEHFYISIDMIATVSILSNLLDRNIYPIPYFNNNKHLFIKSFFINIILSLETEHQNENNLNGINTENNITNELKPNLLNEIYPIKISEFLYVCDNITKENNIIKYLFAQLCGFIDYCQENIKNPKIDYDLFMLCALDCNQALKKSLHNVFANMFSENNSILESPQLRKKMQENYKKYNKKIIETPHFYNSIENIMVINLFSILLNEKNKNNSIYNFITSCYSIIMSSWETQDIKE